MPKYQRWHTSNSPLSRVHPASHVGHFDFEHTLVKLEIKSGTNYVFIPHGPSLLADMLRTMLNYYFVYAKRNFEFYKCVFSKSVTHDWQC